MTAKRRLWPTLYYLLRRAVVLRLPPQLAVCCRWRQQILLRLELLLRRLLALQLQLPMMVLMVHPMILSCCCPGCTPSELGFNQAAEDALDMRSEGPAYYCSSEAPACFCCCCSFVAHLMTRCMKVTSEARDNPLAGDLLLQVYY